jgi:low affinity Fe/Cu permease
MTKPTRGTSERLATLSESVTRWSGSTAAFVLAAGIIMIWVVLGPVFDYSNTWQLVINTGTTIVTFLMVFLIQRSQNKDALAVHIKLNELVAAVQGASNRLIDVESLSEKDLAALGRYYEELAALAAIDVDLTKSHSVEEARSLHSNKLAARRQARHIRSMPTEGGPSTSPTGPDIEGIVTRDPR